MTNIKQKIISGELKYVNKLIREWKFYGYAVVKTKKWSDGKYTIILEKVIPLVGEY